jgi:hypothetical protein
MSESQVDASHVEEIVTQVLTQLVQDGDDEDQLSQHPKKYLATTFHRKKK